jgi:hypothetical protein
LAWIHTSFVFFFGVNPHFLNPDRPSLTHTRYLLYCVCARAPLRRTKFFFGVNPHFLWFFFLRQQGPLGICSCEEEHKIWSTNPYWLYAIRVYDWGTKGIGGMWSPVSYRMCSSYSMCSLYRMGLGFRRKVICC